MEVSIRKCSFVMPRKWGDRKKSTRYVYNLLLKKFCVSPPAETQILQHDFTPYTVQKVYGLPFQIKCDIKITMFQYKIVATKMTLLADTHSLYNMFLRCSSSLAFWKTF